MGNGNISTLSYIYPIILKYGGKIFKPFKYVENFISNSTFYKNFEIINDFKELEKYKPHLIIYTAYEPKINYNMCVHIGIGHSVELFKKNTYHYNINNSQLKQLDFIGCTGEYEVDSFKIRNKPGNFIITGCPKYDIKPLKINIFKNNGNKTIIYCPTWANNGTSIGRISLLLVRLKHYYNILILPHPMLSTKKLHRFYLRYLISQQNNNFRIICRCDKLTQFYKKNNYSLYFNDIIDNCLHFINSSDFVITDLSGIIAETLVCNKPIYITREKIKLSKKLIDERIKNNKTELFLESYHKNIKKITKDYLFSYIGNSSDKIVNIGMEIFKKKIKN